MLKSLLGSGSKDRETAEELREILHTMQQERSRCEAVVENLKAASDRLQQLGEPIAKAGSDTDAVASRIADLEKRFAALLQVSNQLETIDERAEGMAKQQEQSEVRIAEALQDVERIRSGFEDLGSKVDIALNLNEQVDKLLETERPFQQLRTEAEALRTQVDGTGEQLARLREQNDRLMDAHKLALSKTEALDRRRDEIGRSLTDKERRIATVEQAVRGMDGIQQTIDGVKREINTLKALGDSVTQKAATLEAQREAVDHALGQAENLERAMRQIDGGVRQQQENEKTLSTLQEHVVSLRKLHEQVVERSSEIAQVQHEADEHTRATRADLSAVTDEMKKTVERFDFERQGLESVTQRVADLRGTLSDCENRFKGLNQSSLVMGEIEVRGKSMAEQLRSLAEEVGQVDQEMARFQSIRRDLDTSGRAVAAISEQISGIEEAQPAVAAALRDLEQLRSTHAMVKDAVELTKLAHEEIGRMRGKQMETRSWLIDAEQSMGELRSQVGELHRLAPIIEVAQNQAQGLGESMNMIESRKEMVEVLQTRMGELGTVCAELDERSRALTTGMESAEQRFAKLSDHAAEAERLTMTIATVSSQVNDAERKTGEITDTVAAITKRCKSVEEVAEQTQSLRPELEQRAHALADAVRNLERASVLRTEAAESAQQLEELAKKLGTTLSATDKRAAKVNDVSKQIEERAAGLRTVEKRLSQFEERLAHWDPVEEEIARSLEQIAARQGTVESLQADLERMFAVAEKTSADVREITTAQREIEQSRALLEDVTGKLATVSNTADTLEKRKQQTAKAEERLARAEALLVDVQSSLESLQGQKAIVDQAIEKAGSLQFLLKQAEATIDGLKEEREMASRLRAAVSPGEKEDDEEDAAPRNKAA